MTGRRRHPAHPAWQGGLVAILAAATLGVLPATGWAHPSPGAEDYAWVRAPEGTTGAPAAQGREVTLDGALLSHGRADVWTPDLQALVTVAAASPVHVRLAPLDPATLPAVPGLQASGNAYTIDLEGEVTDAVTVLRPPHPVTAVARLHADGWQVVPVSPGADGEVTVPWEGPGPYVAAAPRLDGHGSAIGAFVHDPLRGGLLVLGAAGVAVGVRRRMRPPRQSVAATDGRSTT